ncbi:MAG: GNAT family N-acetyltransferase [Candidatus Lokiarchaeota archaeon]|nr:GNAT family N-acetyltransferase [Candidatus Lokiarchaeota archaeon]
MSNGEEILIRPVKRADVNGIWKNFNEVVEERLYLPVLYSIDSQYEKQSWFDNIKKSNEFCFVAENLNLKTLSNNIVGQCEITNVEWDATMHVGNLGIIINKNYRNMGIGKRLIKMVIKEAKTYNKEKLILSCFSNNTRALNLYEKLRFKRVGIRRKQFLIDSNYYDEVLMELFIIDNSI